MTDLDDLDHYLVHVAELEAEIERLRAALKEIEWSNDTKWQADRARAALEPKS